MSSRPAARRRPPSGADSHRRWLQLVETDGPFLSVPALRRVWSTGMPPLSDAAASALRQAKPAFEKAWDALVAGTEPSESCSQARDAWVETVLRDVLGWGEYYAPGAGHAEVRSPNHRVTVTASGALVRNGATGALVLVVDPTPSLHDNADDGWASSPIDRMEQLLTAADCPIGVVTDGRWWALVSKQRDVMVSSGVVDALTWVEEPEALAAFAELLGPGRLLGGQPADRLPTLFAESVAAAEEITESLGVQVRQAVELIVQAFSEAATDARRRGEPSPLPDDGDQIYSGVVTIMMRVVFLLFAQERGLLPQSSLFTDAYGLSGQLDALRARAQDEGGEEALERTFGVWHRLLATTRVLFRGASFEDVRLPAYGGSLFDPDRFAFLAARNERGTLALPVNDRVMMHVLDAVQLADVQGSRRPISFRDIDVEQIGYIYEGLLGHTCQFVTEPTVGLIGKRGSEPEIPLSVLADLADDHDDDAALAAAIVAWAKKDQPSAICPTPAALTKALRAGDKLPDAARAIRAVTHDPELADELRGWIGIIRRDLRNRPMVVEAGGLLVAETPSRKNAGAHYTPRSLAEEVVLHALEPIVYAPGPYQTPDRDTWVLKAPEEILELKVADIACGSGAFLVAAARYLAARLVEAWDAAGVGVGTPHEKLVDATRQVVANCLYGADINAMAIEMCKLSLWLVSLDPNLPFSFVDDKLLVGNSLLGVTDLAQIRALHIDGTHTRPASLFDIDTDTPIRRAITIRKALASEVDNADPSRSAKRKDQLLTDQHKVLAQLTRWADGVIAAGLRVGGKPGKALDAAYENLRIAVEQELGAGDGSMLEDIIHAGLTPTVPTDYHRWQPLHWALAVPDVMDRGGFDAIVGNPPFLGGKKISGAVGGNVRDWLVALLAGGTAGQADMVAYFFLRAAALLEERGTLGLIATNTLAQGDTREVGLDQMVAAGFTIVRAIQSRTWPARAGIEYAAVWGSVGAVSPVALKTANDSTVAGISTLLEPMGRVTGRPLRLTENDGISFVGCYVLGLGFVLEPSEARAWIAEDTRNAEVLFPYLNGEDLNSQPDLSATRWIIDFNARDQAEAATYRQPFSRVDAKVRPERTRKKADGNFVLRKPLPLRWWQFADKRPALRRAVADLPEMLVVNRHSKTVMPLKVTARQVASDATVVFASIEDSLLAALSSSQHNLWVVSYGSTLGHTTTRYTPSDVFETFPRPEPTVDLDRMGRTLDTERREVMLRRQLGLTKLYNLVNDPGVHDSDDPDVARLRQIHVELDEAVMAAYGWADVPLNHGFHTYRQMERWTVCPEARVEILDRLLELNHERAAAEAAGGLAPTASDLGTDDEADDDAATGEDDD